MKCSFTIICYDKLATGFELAGVDVVGIHDRHQAEHVLEEKRKRVRSEIVVVAQDVMDLVTPRLQEKLRSSTMPAFVELPIYISHLSADEAKTASHKLVSALIQKAVGKKMEVGRSDQ